MRIFKNREEINKICLMDGELPARRGEMAIDRMYADNNGLSVGDTLQSGKKTWKITGLVALSDYSCLFQNNNDSMFDSVKFGVSVVTEEEFDSLNQDKLQYNYSWIYGIQRCMRGYVLWQLQSSDLCDQMECRSLSAYNCSSGDHHAGGKLRSPQT